MTWLLFDEKIEKTVKIILRIHNISTINYSLSDYTVPFIGYKKQ